MRHVRNRSATFTSFVQKRRHLLDELFKVTQIAEPGDDDVVGHLDILVYQNVAESDSFNAWRRTPRR
jgi:hypothetical protein